jgi:glycosyltransferase involved in cell wall biosynthesis
MKILFISSWYPTPKNTNFGVFIKEHAHAIKNSGNEIVVLALVIHKSPAVYSTKLTDSLDEAGVRTVILEINTHYRDLIYHLVPFQSYLVKRLFKKNISSTFNPDIIHSNVIFPAGMIGDSLALSLKKPHIITEHWSRIKGLLDKPILSKMAIRAYERADRILPVSEFLRKSMLSILPSVDTSKYRIVGNVIDSKLFYYKEKDLLEECIRFCGVATWMNKKIPDKMPEMFIEALALLQKELKQKIVLTLIGGGDKVEELRQLCADRDIKAKLPGYQTKTEIARCLQSVDFFVHASTIETFGVVTAEALFCGTPVICSNVGALPELINDSNGILCENNVESWLKAIKRALSTTYNHNSIAEDIKTEFDLSAIGQKINSVYSEF